MNKRQYKKLKLKHFYKKWILVKRYKEWLKDLISPELAKIFYNNLFKEPKEIWQPLQIKRTLPYNNNFRKLGEK